MTARLVVVGSLNVDVRIRLDHIPASGETVVSLSQRQIGLGGKGTNQAVAAARLGAHVVLVAPVGADTDGEWAREQLALEPLLTQLEVVADAPTGQALILVDARGENAIVVESGANGRFDLDSRLAPVVEGADVVLLQLELPVATVAHAARAAQAAGAMVVTNCAPAPASASPELAQLLKDTDVLIVNEIEGHQLAALCVDLTGTDGWRALARLGPGTVVVTRGPDGIVAFTEEDVLEVAAIRSSVVETTGAGDACAAGIAVGLAEGRPLREALELGNAAGALAVGRAGTVSSFGTRDELESVVTRNMGAMTQ